MTHVITNYASGARSSNLSTLDNVLTSDRQIILIIANSAHRLNVLSANQRFSSTSGTKGNSSVSGNW